ncbi:GNAT family N-acetyltransferase [Ferruginibacter paludis]|uniref:GNAT family N-acetyltransferase n=1 Tax=Ferruginibacter paludis TaxID=1310417 RepID=UPI0025B2ACA4|nr:GNAT family N-acetyltransferase [Ferruginibacter paludis]MDN3654155.1 GNAT family N-acetyltransferase [Ferruginibacter paludis]
MPVHYIPYQQIDQIKWDACIESAHNGLVYARSFYLDAMAKHWDALVLNDYEAVMPLTWNKKYGIAYLYQPPFTQQLGIFSTTKSDDTLQQLFIAGAKQRFRFAEFFVNFPAGNAQVNFVLPLQQPYEITRQQYKNDLLKNLKHAAKFHLSYVSSHDIQEAIQLYQLHYAQRMPHVHQHDYARFSVLCQSAKQRGLLLIRKVINDDGATIAVVLLLKDKQRLYNLMSTVTKEGRQCEANHFLFDQLIKEFSGQDFVLDFEGSSIPGIAGFYQKFGAVNEPYFFLRYNHLPWPLKYLK